MVNNKSEAPEIKLLNSIVDEELTKEEDKYLKATIKKKAETLYPLLSLMGQQGLDDEEIKKKIKLLIEED
jgi:hypothetical protein